MNTFDTFFKIVGMGTTFAVALFLILYGVGLIKINVKSEKEE